MLGHDINSYCDRFISPNIRIGRRSYSAFTLWAAAGLITAVSLNLVLANHRGLSLWITTAIIGVALFTSYALACATKILNGEENLAFYHHLIAVLIATSVLMWLLRQPILPYLDVTITSLGAITTLGRIGCLMVGCCHGRPCRFGVRYTTEHAAAGFTPHLVDVRLFPTQLVEALYVLFVVIVGCRLVWSGDTPGAATTWFIASYCSARFCIGFVRWPPGYQRKFGLSQLQWISVALFLFTVCLEFGGVLPFRLWHSLALALLLIVTVAVVIERRLRSFDKDLKHPDHVRELAGAIDSAPCHSYRAATTEKASGFVPLRTTSLGLQVSASRIHCGTGDIYHYAFSCRSESLTEEAAQSLARLIIERKRPSGRTEVLKGGGGVFHLLIYP